MNDSMKDPGPCSLCGKHSANRCAPAQTGICCHVSLTLEECMKGAADRDKRDAAQEAAWARTVEENPGLSTQELLDKGPTPAKKALS